MILRRFMHRTKKDEGRAEEIDSHLTHEQDAHAARLICALEILVFYLIIIGRQLRAARGFEPGQKPGAPCPSSARPCYGLTSAIPPGTSFSKVKVGRPFPHRGG